jgi:hypothetical protein
LHHFARNDAIDVDDEYNECISLDNKSFSIIATEGKQIMDRSETQGDQTRLYIRLMY